MDLLKKNRPDRPACLILDVRMPGVNGMELQHELAQTGIRIPIIFITAHGDIPMSVRAIKSGATEFLTKPFRSRTLLNAVRMAIDQDLSARKSRSEIEALRGRYKRLTPREREVLPLVVGGLLNKQAAAHLGISEITLQIHRTNVMRKMAAQSLADLVRMAGALEIPVTLARRS